MSKLPISSGSDNTFSDSALMRAVTDTGSTNGVVAASRVAEDNPDLSNFDFPSNGQTDEESSVVLTEEQKLVQGGSLDEMVRFCLGDFRTFIDGEEKKQRIITLIALLPAEKRVGFIYQLTTTGTTIVHAGLIQALEMNLTWNDYLMRLAQNIASDVMESRRNTHIFQDVLEYIPEDSIPLLLNGLGGKALLVIALASQEDFAVIREYQCEALLFSEVTSRKIFADLLGSAYASVISAYYQLRESDDLDFSAFLKNHAPNVIEEFFDMLPATAQAWRTNIVDMLTIISYLPVYARTASTELLQYSDALMKITGLSQNPDRLVSLLLEIDPGHRLRMLQNCGLIGEQIGGEIRRQPMSAELQFVLLRLLPSERDKTTFHHFVRNAPQPENIDAVTAARSTVFGSTNEFFENYLRSQGVLTIQDINGWAEKPEYCRVWIAGLLRDCCLYSDFIEDFPRVHPIRVRSMHKLLLLAETGNYPEAELAVAIVHVIWPSHIQYLSPDEQQKYRHLYDLTAFKARDTWFISEAGRANRRVMKALTVACQEIGRQCDSILHAPEHLPVERRQAFELLVDTIKSIRVKYSDAMVGWLTSQFCFLDADSQKKYSEWLIPQSSAADTVERKEVDPLGKALSEHVVGAVLSTRDVPAEKHRQETIVTGVPVVPPNSYQFFQQADTYPEPFSAGDAVTVHTATVIDQNDQMFWAQPMSPADNDNSDLAELHRRLAELQSDKERLLGRPLEQAVQRENDEEDDEEQCAGDSSQSNLLMKL